VSPARLGVELGLLGGLSGLALAAGPHPWPAQAVCAALALASLARPGLAWPGLLAAVLWLGGLRLGPGFAGLWPLGPAALLAAGAALGAWQGRGAGQGATGGRARELMIAGGLALLAALLSAGAAWALLGLRSAVRLSAGSTAWVFPGLVAGAAALGLWLTRLPPPVPGAPWTARLWARRLELTLLLAAAWDAVRVGLAA